MVGVEYQDIDMIPAFNIDVQRSYRSRTLLDVVRIKGRKGNIRTIGVVIAGWDPDKVVNISAKLLPEELKGRLKVGDMLLARINLSANKPKGLRPTNFRLAPPAVKEEDL